MYSAVIANAQGLSQQVAGMPPIAQTAAAISQVKSFADTQIPAMQALAKDVADYVSTANASLADMTGKLAAGAAPADLKGAMDALKSRIGTLEAEAQSTDTGVAGFRDAFSQSCADLQAAKVQLDGQIAGLQAQAQQAQQKAAELEQQINMINATLAVPVIGLLVKLGSELASLITDHKLTEELLAKATNDLAQVRGMQSQIGMAESQVQHLQSLVSQLADGTQNVINAINLIGGMLDNEDQFLASAPDAAKLYLTALGSSLAQLDTIVS